MLSAGYTSEVPRKPMKDRGTIAQWVRTARGKLTQEQFAEKLGVDRSTVGDWERDANEPEPPSVRRIVDRFPDAPPYPTSGKAMSGTANLARDPDHHVQVDGGGTGGYEVKTTEGRHIAEQLDTIPDDALRRRAARKAIAAIDEVLENPPRVSAEKRPDRVHRKHQ